MPKLELQALLAISQIDLTKDLKRILEEILIIVRGVLGGHSGSIMLINEEIGELEMVATAGFLGNYTKRVYSKGVPITSSPFGVVLENGRYYVMQNIFEEPREEPWMDLVRELGSSAQFFMPLKRKGEVIGLLNIYMAEPHEFTENELAFLAIVVSQAAAVIENARLYARISPKKLELEKEIAERRRVEETLRKSEETYRATLTFLSDITERKRAEDALRESKDLVDNILAASPIGIGVVENRKLSWTNKRMMEMFGFNPDEEYYIGKSAEVIYASKEEYERVGKIFYEDLKEGKIVEADAKLKRKDGSIFDSHIIMSFLDPSNPIKGAVATISDISWRKGSEEILKNSEERLRILFEYAPDAYFLGDFDGNFVDCNKAAEEISGYTKEELRGKNFLDFKILFPELQIPKVTAFLAKSAQGQPAGPEEFIVIRKDGKKVFWEIRTFPVKIKDESLILGIARDITERKQVQEALLNKNRELEREIQKRKQIENMLKLSEQRYKEIAAFLPEQIYGSMLILS
jgi:PAS domain S-box-containing protein